MPPVALRRHQKRGGDSPPPSSSSLTSPLDGRRVSPLVLGSHGVGGVRAPPRLDLSLCLFVCLRSPLLPFHRSVYIYGDPQLRLDRNLRRDFFIPKISFLAAEEGNQPPYGWPTRVRGAPRGAGAPPYLVATSGTISRGFFFWNFPNIPKISSVRFYSVWTPFDMDILRNQKHATNRNWHWALDQYVSPKNSIKSCQKYMEVV